ncbi:MAG: discoidin domain-containing protein [Phycisphaerae bacterium]|nr:discoidin domain-containing protein [Phycisphaerae bacterium]
MSWRAMVMIVLAAGGLGAGCNGSAYQPGRAEAAAITPRNVWRVTGDLRTPPAAVDHNISTAAVSADSSGRGTITLDLSKPCLFNMVVIEHGLDEMGFAPRVAVQTSLDGQTFTQRYVGVGTRRVTILYLGGPVLARYVRLQALAAGQRPWCVAEVYLY